MDSGILLGFDQVVQTTKGVLETTKKLLITKVGHGLKELLSISLLLKVLIFSVLLSATQSLEPHDPLLVNEVVHDGRVEAGFLGT